VLTARDATILRARVRTGGTATIVMSGREHALAFAAQGLRALPPTRCYELWLMAPGRDRSAGMLPGPRHGMTGPVLASGSKPVTASASPSNPPADHHTPPRPQCCCSHSDAPTTGTQEAASTEPSMRLASVRAAAAAPLLSEPGWSAWHARIRVRAPEPGHGACFSCLSGSGPAAPGRTKDAHAEQLAAVRQWTASKATGSPRATCPGSAKLTVPHQRASLVVGAACGLQ